ncbi:DNA topoisomerase IV subunit A, partial [human gut metagenome]
EGFFGIGKSMKDSEFVCDCSDIDDVIVFTKEGRYVITKVSDKAFFQKGIYYIGVFKRNDERTIYNVLYRDGKNGPHDEALRHQGHHARQGVRHHQGHAQERDTLYVCQSER